MISVLTYGLNRLPIRIRLALAYLLTFGLILVAFSLFIYLRVQRDLLVQVDSGLELAAVQTAAIIDPGEDELSFENIESTPDTLQRLDNLTIYLLNEEGVVLDRLGRPDNQSVLPLVSGARTLVIRDHSWRVYMEPYLLPNRRIAGWIQVIQSLDPIEQTLRGLLTQLSIGVPIALVLAGIGGVTLAIHALRPIDQITRTARAIDETDLTRRIGYTGPQDEVGRLAGTFDRMLDRLQHAFQRQMQFTGDAAHELRTPLAALKARIGVTLNHHRRRAEYEDALQDMDRQVDRLINLIQQLLFMARLDQNPTVVETETIPWDEFIHGIVEQVSPLATEKAINIRLESDSVPALRGDLDMLIRLFLNLVGNAIDHTPAGGSIEICTYRKQKMIYIEINNSGYGIPPEHLPHLFERFYRVESARSRNNEQEGGAGLGLAIAREIVRAHKGTLTVESELNKSTTFTVQLPAF